MRKVYYILILLLPFLASCRSEYQWGWHVLNPLLNSGWDNIRFLISGYGYTISLTLVSIFFSLLIGIVLVVMDMIDWRPLKVIIQAYLIVFRSIPVVVLIIWVYYGLPVVVGIMFSPFVAAVVALALADAAFESEILRSGINAIDQRQLDSADALGLKFIQKLYLIIMPQALRIILPALINQSIYMLKMSSLASFIGFTDLTRRATELVVNVYRPLEIYSFLVLEYLLLVMVMTWIGKRFEAKMKHKYYLQ